MCNTRFKDAIQSGRVTLLDGGMATQLEAQGEDLSGLLWSARLLAEKPGAIVAATRAYLDAGADIVETASYQASREGFREVGMGGLAADRLLLVSVELARRARDDYVADNPDAPVPLVAASIGPWGAVLHDGSEYRGDYTISREWLAEFHERRLDVLDDAGADVLALETIPSLMEAEVLAALLRECRTPAWVSFSCRDGGHICDGTPIERAVSVFEDHPVVLAVGVNCTPPQFVPELIRRIRDRLPGKAIVAYPNSGETWDAATERWHGTVSPLDCAAAAKAWVDAGATIVGGCCRMGPGHIGAMRAAINR